MLRRADFSRSQGHFQLGTGATPDFARRSAGMAAPAATVLRMRRLLIAPAAALLLALPSGGQTPSPASEVRVLERQWLDAYEHRDAAAMETILAPGFAITYPDGTLQSRQEVIDFVARHKGEPGPRFHTEETTATDFGTTVVLRGIVVSEQTRNGVATRTAERYTDTYTRAGQRWQVAASHLSLAEAEAATPPPPPQPEQVTLAGTAVHHLTARANGIAYKLYVSVPTGYSTSTARYPVLYLLDADYSFPVARSIVQHLSDRQRLQPIIVVGIAYDGPDLYRLHRTRDYTPRFSPTGGYSEELQKQSGGGPKFLQFIREELIPYIDGHYRTDPAERGLVGHSFGGLFATWVLLTSPATFNHYVIVSPSLWYGDRFVFDTEKSTRSASAPRARVFLGVGSREVNDERDMVRDLATMAAALAHRPSLQLKREVFDDETHDSVFPTAFSRGIRFTFKGD